MSRFGRILAWFGGLFLWMISLGLIGMVVLISATVSGIPRVPDELNRLISVQPTEVYASDGSMLTQVGGRKAVPFDRISPEFRMAVLAAEDDQFYEHHGVDKPALLRATVGAILGSHSRGGSTITQQLARNLFFTFEKTWTRKFREILATLEIERRFTKDQILTAYCNGVYFGNYAYGVEEAATSYFGKHASNLTLAQAALLAGLPQSPSRYNPYRYPQRAIARQSWILGRLKYLGWIDDAQFSAAMAEPLNFKPLYTSADEGSYFLDAVLDGLEEKYGKTVLYHGGLKIYTTLDPVLQGYAVQAVQSGLGELDERLGLKPFDPNRDQVSNDYPQAALVAVEAATGAVQALIGGRDWQASQFNRAVQSQRNMGSVMKPILYLTAIERLGVHPATLTTDSAIVIEIPGTTPWAPKNFEPYFEGQLILKRALEHSINTVAARLMVAVHPEAMVETIKRFGVTSPQQPVYSLALGGTSISPVELAAIGGSIANLGEVVEPYLIRRIEDPRGRILEEHIVRRRSAFDQESVYLLVDMMKGVLKEGTARGASRYGFDLPAIGKTGTTDDFRDSWFLGSTPRLSSCAWVGFDDNRSMRDSQDIGITGASGALPIWSRFMVKATEGEPPRDFPVPPGIKFAYVDPVKGVEVPEKTSGAMRVALPENAVLPDSTLLKIESAWLDSLAADSTHADSLEVLP